MLKGYTYEHFKASADYVMSQIDFQPEIAIVLGSSLGSLADEIESPVVVDYKDIPNFLLTTNKSHAGKLIMGKLGGKYVVCMSGRFHYYEGYDFEELTAPIRLFKLMGVKATILTNAAGASNPEYNVGDIMIIKDHLKFMGASPMRGPNVDEIGPRFFDMTRAYTPELRELAKKCAANVGQTLREGNYFYWTGPQFETPAEIRAIQILGGDAVGMSTVTEAITAAHCGMPLLALSLITNMAAGILDQPIDDDEVGVAARQASANFKTLLREIVKEM